MSLLSLTVNSICVRCAKGKRPVSPQREGPKDWMTAMTSTFILSREGTNLMTIGRIMKLRARFWTELTRHRFSEAYRSSATKGVGPSPRHCLSGLFLRGNNVR